MRRRTESVGRPGSERPSKQRAQCRSSQARIPAPNPRGSRQLLEYRSRVESYPPSSLATIILLAVGVCGGRTAPGLSFAAWLRIRDPDPCIKFRAFAEMPWTHPTPRDHAPIAADVRRRIGGLQAGSGRFHKLRMSESADEIVFWSAMTVDDRGWRRRRVAEPRLFPGPPPLLVRHPVRHSSKSDGGSLGDGGCVPAPYALCVYAPPAGLIKLWKSRGHLLELQPARPGFATSFRRAGLGTPSRPILALPSPSRSRVPGSYRVQKA
jgi:hypothetical protein